MRPAIKLGLAALLFSASAQAQDIGQMNWRVTDAERRLALNEQAIANLGNQLQSLNTRFAQLESRFNQLVNILDQRMREEQARRAEEELRKKQEEKPEKGPKPAK